MAGPMGAAVGAGVGLLSSIEKQQQDRLNNQRIVDQARGSMFETLINKKFTGAPVEDIKMSGNVEAIAKGAAAGATGGVGGAGGKKEGLGSLFAGLSKGKKPNAPSDENFGLPANFMHGGGGQTEVA